MSHRAELSWGLKLAASRWPVTMGFTLAILLAGLALVLVLGNQNKLKSTDKGLKDAVDLIQESRRESIKTICKAQKNQNKVLLSLVPKRRLEHPTLRLKRILKALNPDKTNRDCLKALQETKKPPPPP